jgi:murein DD-endopeptidase MepM/ murein hydrolase activator NlpD
MGIPGRPLGDGFFLRHGVYVENTWFNPNHWHTGEDWYLQEGDTAGANVYAIAEGTVQYVGSNYPGRVVIIQHPDGLYSMYGHLDPAVAVQVGQAVERGAFLGTILRRSDNVPAHLHFEVRTFYTTREVNGAAPRYGFPCGVNCPPGPGYWPIAAPDHPSDLGWRNPSHVMNNRATAPAEGQASREVVVAAQPPIDSAALWSSPPTGEPQQQVGILELQPGERYTLLDTWTGPEDTRQTSARSYQLWYHIRLPDGQTGWMQAAVPSTFETGSDGRPASVFFLLLPAVTTPDPS